ncbi:Mlp family lipoprotein [Saccharococcus thermophilus]|uniref:ABC-type phosphate/phosphonate transport system ATPase subunit n=1 Tax=Saccharococcus thermophilus TaxID=29396 RepID=A0A846MGV1_9BACL|nr:Mlp family lipoprotein [Saccharococcus thermophilus]NIK15323.1 ABC-type phosphate/phosphonate transport system ATPase subunit [Saccharococcus thermophilus]
MEKEHYIKIKQDELIKFKELFFNFQYESERLENVLCGFLNDHNLGTLFLNWLMQQKKQSESDDMINEVYGDIDELITRFNYYFLNN